MAKTADPLNKTRRDRFRDYCKRKGWIDVDGAIQRKKIADAIGKSAQQVGNLLDEKYSFAGPVARDIEQKLQLPPYYLDGNSAAWPFSKELQAEVNKLDADGLRRAENALRAHLDMDMLPRAENRLAA